ncbi:Metalloendopeptidase OMA1, mitochondrial [Channa argus]|uniref:Metalloendopeptidase OMA1, mitochondrial n=1 Tax=Channa argus TaxID=215402 RepID=A0A6G1PMC1_CHAAH|nr:Metalloendopeptidase OMA1, mitochondrial [Channa argus]
MLLPCINLLGNRRLFSLYKPLTRNVTLSPKARAQLKQPYHVSSRISCQRTTNSVPFIQTGPRVCSSAGTLCFTTTSTLHPGAFLTQCGHHIHTSTPLRALPAPLIWMVLKPLQKLAAIILGRSIRKWWAALPDNRRQLMREWAWQRRWYLAAGTGIAMVILALLLLTHLDETPVTGRARLLVFSRENYMELAAVISEAYMEEFADMLLPVTDSRHQVVELLVQHLAEKNKDIPEMSEVTWSVQVVQSPIINAFVLPAEQASLSHVVDFLSLILLTAIWALCPRDSVALLGQWVQNKLTQGCADVRAGPVFWQQMEIREQLTGETTVPEWLSTHPSHRNRSTQLDRLIPQALDLRESCLCPALPASDPRVMFSKSVRTLLDQEKRGPERASKPHLSPILSSLPNAAFIPSTLFTASQNLDEKRRGLVPVIEADEAAPVPTLTEQNKAQHSVHITS